METLSSQRRELLILPGSCAAMPHGPMLRLLTSQARKGLVFADLARAARIEAGKAGLVDDPEEFEYRFRLTKAVDSVDPWLTATRSDRWLQRYVDVYGSWPDASQRPFSALSIHWGAAFWSLRHLQRHAGPTSVMMRRRDVWAPTMSRPLQLYIDTVYRLIKRASGYPGCYIDKGLRQRLQQLRTDGINLFSLIDVPPSPEQHALVIDFCNQPTRWITGTVRAALGLDQPIVPYVMGLNPDSLRRELHIGKPLEKLDLEDTMRALVQYFEVHVRRQPWAWHWWPLFETVDARKVEAKYNEPRKKPAAINS